MTSSGRLTIGMGLCAWILSACGVSDRPLNVTNGASDTGGESSNGGAVSTGGRVSGGGAPSNGGIATLGGRPSGGGGGALNGSGGSGPIGTDTTPSVTGPASTTSDGTLTSLRGASFVKTSGTIVITSFYAIIEVLPSFNSIQLWGDIENRGASLACVPNVTLAINGYDILTTAAGPAYRDSSSVSTVCLPPGGRGAINGIDINASSTLLDSASNTVTYSIDASASSSAVPHPGAPSLTGVTIDNSTGLYVISGTMQAGSVDIYNLGLDFFIRDSSGLLRDDQSAFPADLGTIPAGSTTPFNTSGSSDAFARYVEFPDFIEGVAMNALQGPVADFEARRRLVKQRFAAVIAARRIIHR